MFLFLLFPVFVGWIGGMRETQIQQMNIKMGYQELINLRTMEVKELQVCRQHNIT